MLIKIELIATPIECINVLFLITYRSQKKTKSMTAKTRNMVVRLFIPKIPVAIFMKFPSIISNYFI